MPLSIAYSQIQGILAKRQNSKVKNRRNQPTKTKVKMTCWSAENATKAYLRALKMGKRGKEPDVAEFISAIAGGNNAQLMVMASAGAAGSAALALVAAARQTGGRVVCIVPTLEHYRASKSALVSYAESIKFIVGDAKALLLDDYKEADFVLIDCNISDHEGVFRAAQEGIKPGGHGVIIGCNALHKGSSGWWSGFQTHFLPIGDGLLLTRREASRKNSGRVINSRKRSRWIVKVDKGTGEEHVFRITSPLPAEETEA